MSSGRRSSEARQEHGRPQGGRSGLAVRSRNAARCARARCRARLESSFGQARRPAAPRSRIGRSSRYAGARVGTREGSQRLPDRDRERARVHQTRRSGAARFERASVSRQEPRGWNILRSRHRKSTARASRADRRPPHRFAWSRCRYRWAATRMPKKARSSRPRARAFEFRTATSSRWRSTITSFLRRRPSGSPTARVTS